MRASPPVRIPVFDRAPEPSHPVVNRRGQDFSEGELVHIRQGARILQAALIENFAANDTHARPWPHSAIAALNAADADAAPSVRHGAAEAFTAPTDVPPAPAPMAPFGVEPPAPLIFSASLRAASWRLLAGAAGSRWLKAAAGLLLIGYFGWKPAQALLTATSVEAVVNSRVVTIRSPIEGVMVTAPHNFENWSSAGEAPSVQIQDATASRARLDDLRLRLGALEDDRPSIAERLGQTQESVSALSRQSEKFQSGRIEQLDARIGALKFEASAADARASEARSALERAKTQAGDAPDESGLAPLRRDQKVAKDNAAAAHKRVDEALAERSAAKKGVFVGDGSNDRPVSAQRADDMKMRASELRADLIAHDNQILRLRGELNEEEERYKNVSDIKLPLPPTGAVWEVLTAAGEHVSRGQELFRLLDCASAVVTANVNESVFNRLHEGAPARFQPSNGGAEYSGRVVALSGLSAAAANFAIQPGALAKEAYHVTISIPEIAKTGDCGVGRTGRIIFDANAPPARDARP